jgi:hypothetical protein
MYSETNNQTVTAAELLVTTCCECFLSIYRISKA